MYRTSRSNTSRIKGTNLAQGLFWHKSDYSLGEIVALAWTMKSLTTDDRTALLLSFILTYIHMAGMHEPDYICLTQKESESVNTLTHYQGKVFSTMDFGSLNQLQLIGNLGKNPELAYTNSSKTVARGSIAVPEYGGKDDAGNKLESTMWVNWVAWDYLADQMEQFCKKGDTVFLQGRLSMRKYTDREGFQRQTTEIVVKHVVKLKQAANGNAHSKSTEDVSDPFLPDYPDDLGQHDSEDQEEQDNDRVPTGELA